ncbi:hypothetical protein RPALISO_87 [Ruegeria phage RpAliso]|nr:hypothetical protein RPALISO_87 [Ruegeria phage RpAliso]
MAKATITFEDVGSKSVSILTEIEGMEAGDQPATPAMAYTMATRAMFESGMLAEAASAALEGIAKGMAPTECILASFKKIKTE